jgi:hypothetical protein
LEDVESDQHSEVLQMSSDESMSPSNRKRKRIKNESANDAHIDHCNHYVDDKFETPLSSVVRYNETSCTQAVKIQLETTFNIKEETAKHQQSHRQPLLTKVKSETKDKQTQVELSTNVTVKEEFDSPS